MRATARRRTRRRRVRTMRAAAAVAAVMVLAGCVGPPNSARDVSAAVGAAAGEDASTGLTRWAPADRSRLPRLVGRTLDGARLDVADWRGRVVVVNTWGSWCGPCREEAPALQRAYDATKNNGVQFVGIDTRDNDAAARAFVREFGISYPSLVDRDGRLLLGFGQTIPVSAVPTTVVADPRGRIAARVIGVVTFATLRGLIDDARAEDRGRPAGESRP